MDKPQDKFKFEISLSVLNHLGRNLYRNFITVLGEAISNSWDADAKNVWIDVDRSTGAFSIKDDGHGMSANDFQAKFLRIGYSKRKQGAVATNRSRPFIGAKGIGKLALLSCAERVSIFTKKSDAPYVGGVIDNSGLDHAIKSDLTPEKYPLETLNMGLIRELAQGHGEGTIIFFEGAKDKIRNSIAHIRKLIAMNFCFSLLDDDFAIHVNGARVTLDDVKDLLDATEFTWVINRYEGEFVSQLSNLKRPPFVITNALAVSGFISTVVKPRDLKIAGTEERATVDLFVNGRLREKNILRHIPTQRIVESYIYGQIHFDSMDRSKVDPFTSSREGVIEDDKNLVALLEFLKKEALPVIFDQWDKARLERGEEGDAENKRKSKKDRKANDLYSATREEYESSEKTSSSDQVDQWLNELRDDASFNLSCYADCFISENLVRKYIKFKDIEIVDSVRKKVKEYSDSEEKYKGAANLSINIRKSSDHINYLGMHDLAFVVEGKKERGAKQSLWEDAISYAPVRNVIGHTGLLTDVGKAHLNLRYENIKARIRTLVLGDSQGEIKK